MKRPRGSSFIGALHEQLLDRLAWYRRWHRHRHYQLVHYGVLVSVLLFSLITIRWVAVPYPGQPPVLAATKSWDSQSDWQGWSQSNSSSSHRPGSLSLKPSSVSATNNGTLKQTASWTTRTSGSSSAPALQFPGGAGSGYVEVNDSVDWNPGGAWTVEAWVKTSVGGYVISKRKYESDSDVYLWINTETNQAEFCHTTIGHNECATSSSAVTTNAWTHLAGVIAEDGSLKIFVNGNLEGNLDHGASYSSSMPWQIGIIHGGDEPDPAWYLSGLVDEVRISQAEVYTGSFSPPFQLSVTGSTLGLWHINEGQGTALQNATAISYPNSGSASLTLTPEAGKRQTWQSRALTLTNNGQTVTESYSTDGVAYGAFSSVQNKSSESLYLKLSLSTTDSRITPAVESLSLSYSLAPDEPSQSSTGSSSETGTTSSPTGSAATGTTGGSAGPTGTAPTTAGQSTPAATSPKRVSKVTGTASPVKPGGLMPGAPTGPRALGPVPETTATPEPQPVSSPIDLEPVPATGPPSPLLSGLLGDLVGRLPEPIQELIKAIEPAVVLAAAISLPVAAPVARATGQMANLVFVGYVPRRKRQPWGIVQDGEGLPVFGALVQLGSVEKRRVVASTTTDREGRFSFLVTTPGQYLLKVSQPLYQPYTTVAFAIPEPTSPNVNQTIELGELPVTNAKPRVSFWQRLQLLHFPILLVGLVINGLNVLVYGHTGFLPLLLVAGYLGLFSFSLYSKFRTVKPYGTVSDATSKQAVPLALIRAISQLEGRAQIAATATSDEQGRYQLLLLPGQYGLRVSKVTYQPFHQLTQVKRGGLRQDLALTPA